MDSVANLRANYTLMQSWDIFSESRPNFVDHLRRVHSVPSVWVPPSLVGPQGSLERCKDAD